MREESLKRCTTTNVEEKKIRSGGEANQRRWCKYDEQEHKKEFYEKWGDGEKPQKAKKE